MDWFGFGSLIIGSGLLGALIQRVIDHKLAKRQRKTDMGTTAATKVIQELDEIIKVAREHTWTTGNRRLPVDIVDTLMTRPSLYRHIQVIPDARIREELRIVDVSVAEALVPGMADQLARSALEGRLRLQAEVIVGFAVYGMSVAGAYIRGDKVSRPTWMVGTWEVFNKFWAERDTDVVGPSLDRGHDIRGQFNIGRLTSRLEDPPASLGDLGNDRIGMRLQGDDG